MDLVLDGLMANLVEGEELDKVLLPRLLSCVSLCKVNKFKKVLECFNVDFQEGALLSFLTVSGEAKFINILAMANYYLDVTDADVTNAITEQNRRSFQYALRTGRSGVVQPLFRNFPWTFGKQLEDILLDPLPILGTVARVESVKK